MIEHVEKFEKTPIKRADQDTKDAWMEAKADLLEKDEMLGHAYQQKLDAKEKVVEAKLAKMRQKMLDEDPCLITDPHYSKLDQI